MVAEWTTVSSGRGVHSRARFQALWTKKDAAIYVPGTCVLCSKDTWACALEQCVLFESTSCQVSGRWGVILASLPFLFRPLRLLLKGGCLNPLRDYARVCGETNTIKKFLQGLKTGYTAELHTVYTPELHTKSYAGVTYEKRDYTPELHMKLYAGVTYD
jgi:hypothetical protein